MITVVQYSRFSQRYALPVITAVVIALHSAAARSGESWITTAATGLEIAMALVAAHESITMCSISGISCGSQWISRGTLLPAAVRPFVTSEAHAAAPRSTFASTAAIINTERPSSINRETSQNSEQAYYEKSI